MKPPLENDSNRYERILLSFDQVTNGNSSAFAQASKEARAKDESLSGKAAEIRSVSCGVAGPVLCSYVLWILSRSVELGLKRLYFISRDGERLMEIAQRLLPAFWLGYALEIRYLHGSRQAWILPSFLASNPDAGHYVLIYFDHASLKSIFARVELTLDDCRPVLAKYGFSETDWERPFTPPDRERVETLLSSPEIQASILSQALKAKDNALGYLEQEGLFEGVPYGLVDLGWAGVQKGALEGILSLRGKAAPPFFFFGRIKSPCRDNKATLHAYHFDIDQAVGMDREIPGITQVMELFCSSLSGGLQRYDDKDGRYEPVSRQPNNKAIQEWGFAIMRDAIIQFADKLAEIAPHMKQPAFLPPEVSDVLLQAFWRKPTRAEAQAWGEFPFDEDTSGVPPQHLAPPIGPQNFWRAFRYGRGFEQYTEWSRGIAAANGPLLGFLWRACLAGYKVRTKFERLMLGRKGE